MSDADTNAVDAAIAKHCASFTRESLEELYDALLAGEFLVALSADEEVVSEGAVRTLPIICGRSVDGLPALPVFTSLAHLYEWKPEGCRYTNLGGRVLFSMATGMADIEVIVVNGRGAPRGHISRAEFVRLSEGIKPVDLMEGR
jgi:hypothetical protein